MISLSSSRLQAHSYLIVVTACTAVGSLGENEIFRVTAVDIIALGRYSY